MSENKTGKYFKYAIGEIILVVIGILIALQINNWNEERKRKTKEIAILENLKISVTEDLVIHDFHVYIFEEARISMQILLDHMEQNLAYHDSLKYHFGNTTHLWNPHIKLEIYENLKSEGFDLISNESLKQKVLNYYSFAATDFASSKERYSNIMSEASSTIFNTRFNSLWNANYDLLRKSKLEESIRDLKIEMIPNDFESLKKDDEYLYFLRSLKNQHYWFAERNNKEAKRLAEELQETVNNELQSIKK